MSEENDWFGLVKVFAENAPKMTPEAQKAIAEYLHHAANPPVISGASVYTLDSEVQANAKPVARKPKAGGN